jgi:HEPN domain-containing protein
MSQPKALTPDKVRAEAVEYYEQWFPKVGDLFVGYEAYRNISNRKLAVFTLHQAVESLYHCLLLVLTLYSPKSHRITMLRSQAEALDDRLKVIWPNDTKLHRQAFDRLRRAYVEARYSAAYEITDEELAWIAGQVKQLQQIVGAICEDRLNQAHLSD